ncbi:MAG: FAD-dependent thymidylate synthase [Patescibacteria group bacterium]|mgnify:CR=1 FL=1
MERKKEILERIFADEQKTLRPISEGAEKWLNRPIKCLDYGFVYLVDYMGNDEAVAQAASVSYGRETKNNPDLEGLIRYLRRHTHTTPSEMVEFKFHCKMPIFVARQWIRHRTANVNEYSGRYSEMLNEFYLPEPSALRKQSKTNKQGRDEELTPEQCATILDLLKEDYQRTFEHYQKFLTLDLAKELSRINLSVANYTQWYWKIDLHNLLHFLRLRLDTHAQYEICIFGEAMSRIVKDAVPICYRAFEDYQLHSMRFSRVEIEIISQNTWPMQEQVMTQILEQISNKRERAEFLEKLKKLNFL